MCITIHLFLLEENLCSKSLYAFVCISKTNQAILATLHLFADKFGILNTLWVNIYSLTILSQGSSFNAADIRTAVFLWLY